MISQRQKKLFGIVVIMSTALLFSCGEELSIDEPGNLVPKTVTQDTSLPTIYANGAWLHSEAFGPEDGTMIIAIHGGPGGDYRYLLNCKDLTDSGYRVVFYDQRGSGLSERFPKRSYISLKQGAIDLMYDELTAVISHYRKSPNQKVILFGHSWGAILASGYLGKYPDMAQGLILCEPGGLKWKEIEDYIKESRSFKYWGEILNDATYLDQFITGKEDQHEILDYKMAMMASRNDITGEGDFDPSSNWRSGAVIMDALFSIGEAYKIDFSEGLENYTTPSLFFYSGRNRAYHDSWAQKITSHYTNIQVVKVSGVGHDGIVTNTQAWNEQTKPAIINYINSL
ncbi:alpha/beta hydrolase [Flavobacterium lindanitolerans]|uniref:Proline iminopeptidase n=1 Tax=Flavobacterium lindanitolerans TaxID=428988 RepID=A0A497UV67_9FLAO|nr:alpha/beta hydrolase [Flavobacterium lindanitolerans]PKW29629.1 proline iminopeptidase [Flavobacterium lindanitolerans]RLJ34870.1 proline iminopeptidase [Flavobacterium lindanitolerans]